MYTVEENRLINLSDGYTVLYGYLVRALLDEFGVEGDAAAREGTRRYGADRGRNSREKHLKMGAKINMKSLFGLGGDLPPDPRFRRELQELNPQERISHTLICPMADTWKAYGMMAIGRMYCEEFHFACYNTYAYGYTQVELAKTQTQEGDEYCAFNVILRPENLPDELKPVCFAEYDPAYVQPSFTRTKPDGKIGFNSLSVKIFYYLLEAAEERLGEKGRQAIAHGLNEAAKDAVRFLKKSAEEQGIKWDAQFYDYNYPFYFDNEHNPMWEQYSKHGTKEMLEKEFFSIIKEGLGK